MSSLPVFLAQVTNAVNAATDTPGTPVNPVDAAAKGNSMWTMFGFYALIVGLVYFMFLRPQSQAKKQQEEKINTAKTGDKIVTSSGIHGIITNVKDSTVIVRVADNVKLEIEKSHIDKITRDSSESDKTPAKA
jgi:preprotein translocase subunit YajC